MEEVLFIDVHVGMRWRVSYPLQRSLERNPSSAPLPAVTEGRAAAQSPSHLAPHLGIVHVPEEAVGLGIQDKVSPEEFATVLIVFDIQKPTDSVLPIHIRHSWALLTSPCTTGGRETGEKEEKVGSV